MSMGTTHGEYAIETRWVCERNKVSMRANHGDSASESR